ncbi:hypothetical protein [Blastococcus capsensis]|uniref:hypothetical protein n=1 Tax=Blastococcus capsensis TaxID=1564163 RepID=UPI00253FD569|nr:hypothetical protein [Blastococcus capsensis]MDK3257026.1 hypothetical protein [Blastococcus capsensis]
MGMPVDLEVTGEPAEFPQPVDVSAVRVVREARSDVVRHAGAAAPACRWTGRATGSSSPSPTTGGR